MTAIIPSLDDRAAARRTLGAALDNRENNFNLVRLVAAVAVVISHSFLILRAGDDVEPLSWAAFNLGATSVNVFFVLSGIMVSRSFARRPNLGHFVRGRLLRIYPGLLVASAVTALVIVPLAADVSMLDMLRQPSTLLYPFKVLFAFEDAGLANAFAGNIRPDVNSPLWTVKYELAAYAAFAALIVIGLHDRKRLLAVLLVISGIGLAFYADAEWLPGIATSLMRFSFGFLVGVLAYQVRDRLVLSPLLGIAGVAVALAVSGWAGGPLVSIIAFGYLAISLGGLAVPIAPLTQRHDLSFGIYLYSWPVQQALAHGHVWQGDLVYAHIALSLVIATGLAALSWMFIEQPAMRLR